MARSARTTSRDLAVAAARAAADKKATDVVVLEVRDLIVITDYFVICSGTSDRQVRTIAEAVEKALSELGTKAIRREGRADGRWVLLDFVDLVVHVFVDEERRYYELERLWSDAPKLRWEPRAKSGSKKPASGKDKAG